MSWPLRSLMELIVDATGGNTKTLQSDFLPAGKYPIVDQGQRLIAGYTNDPTKIVRANLPLIIFGDHTKAIKYIDFPFCLGADGTKVLVPTSELNASYLFHFLRQIELPEAGYSRHFKYLKEIEIPLPPLDEQRRIAAILDQADTLRRKRREALASLASLTGGTFVEMFGDPLTSSAGYPRRPLVALGKVSTGATPPSSSAGMFDGPIPFVTPGDLDHERPVRRSLTPAGANAVRTVRGGATFVCCIGATIGKMGIAKQKSAFNQQINAIEWDTEVDDLFGLNVLQFYREKIALWGASTTLPILKKSSFEKIEIPVPPIALQRKFAERVRDFNRMTVTMSEQAAHLDALFAALQHRAFRGEL